MGNLEDMALAALSGEALVLRSLVQDWLQENVRVADCPCPSTSDPEVLAMSAALAELLAERTGQPAPGWTSVIGPLPQPRYLLASAATMKRTRLMCEQESPAPLRRRNLFAPAGYLTFA